MFVFYLLWFFFFLVFPRSPRVSGAGSRAVFDFPDGLACSYDGNNIATVYDEYNARNEFTRLVTTLRITHKGAVVDLKGRGGLRGPSPLSPPVDPKRPG